MINFPVVESLDIDGYSLYPGRPDRPGFSEEMTKPLTLLIGANGLGKSTVLALLFRLLTGPSDIPGAMGEDDLGFASTQVKGLNQAERREFAARTTDGAIQATATVRVRLGASIVEVERRLRDLKLEGASVDGNARVDSEESFQRLVAGLANLPSFSEWILCLRFITFYRDDRQVLFWDRSAQRQLLRALFLPPSDASEWARLERDALEADSAYRNFRTYFNGRQRVLRAMTVPATDGHEALAAELSELLETEAEFETSSSETADQLRRAEERVSTSRYELLQAQLALESTSREYEHAKMTVLARHFPTEAESALYLWNQLLANDHCLVCGNFETGLASQIEERINSSRCPLCGSPVHRSHTEPSEIAEARLERSSHELDTRREAVSSLERSVSESERLHDEIRVFASAQSLEAASRRSRIATLQRSLPSSESAYAAIASEVSRLQLRFAELEQQLQAAAVAFESYVESKSSEIAENADAIRDRFTLYAGSFLVDAGEFTWSPREERIGQSEYRARFPAFELALGRSDGASVALRSGLDDVSESQKEFIDLAFRMALIDVAGSNGAGTVVIDTPESSLDTVFAERAAAALAAFLDPIGNGKLVIASNVTGSPLVPLLLAAVRARSRESAQVINLFDIAQATPAVREYEARYREAVGEMIA